MTKKVEKSKAKESKSGEQYVIRSGSHTRHEGGKSVKFNCGDLIVPTAEELRAFPLKFLTLDAYESLIQEDARRTRETRALDRAMFAPRVKKLGARDSESLKRQAKLLRIQRGRERRTLMS